LSTRFLVEHEHLDLAEHPWYQDILYYLQFQKCLDNLEYHECRRVCLEASKYLVLGTSLFCRTVDILLLRCVNNTTNQNILNKIQGSKYSGIHVGGHFSTKTTAHNILRIGYYWPSIFKDSYKFA
jgi:hypothetical protein